MTLILLVAALAAQAGQWEPVAQDAAGQYFVDPASIARDSGGVRLRVRVVAHSAGPGGVRSVVSTIIANCSARTFTPVEVAFYNDGGTLLNSARGNGSAVAVVAGTGDEGVLRRACG